MFSADDERFMRLALEQAQLALLTRDVPIGAVAVKDNQVIGVGYNRREADNDPTAHAEMFAIRQASQKVGFWRLEEVTLYCTLEPCCMCAGAMVLSRLPHLIYATPDPKAGAGGSVHIKYGLLADEAADLIRSFFRQLRAEGQK
jgi:tRNA(adenine34) deaminase